MENHLKHVVLIPDGNRRWAAANKLKVAQGHKKGSTVVNMFLNLCKEYSVQVATVWGFSTENWKRESREVDAIMSLVSSVLKKNIKKFDNDEIKLKHLGRKDRLERYYPSLIKEITRLERTTRNHKGFTLNLALDYGGQDEIVRAINKILLDKTIANSVITTDIFKQFLDTAGQPDPDLIIRTSGETRLSGILPFQSVYSELNFCEEYLPQLTKEKLHKIFSNYLKTERRMGGTPNKNKKV